MVTAAMTAADFVNLTALLGMGTRLNMRLVGSTWLA
jgi:hypothetical protein